MLSRAEMQRDSERQQTRQSEEQHHVSNDNGAMSSECLSPPFNLRRCNCVSDTWNYVCTAANVLRIWTERPELCQMDGNSAQAEFTQEWSAENRSRVARAVQQSRH